MSVRVITGDSRVELAALKAESVDSCATDPPYALTANKKGGSGAGGFMGKKWDTGETAFDPDFWREVLRVLKPGAHLVAFGGTRTYHRLVCAIEDAGFEIRDQIAWIYGSGFPKSHDVSKGIDRMNGDARAVIAEGAPVKRMIPGADQHKGGWEKNSGREFTPTITAAASAASAAWEGWGTALKPALEPIVLARKPLIGTVAANVLAHGTGALNIDASRVETDENNRSRPARTPNAILGGGRGANLTASENNDLGRWPANVIHDGSEEVEAAFPQTGVSSGGCGEASKRTALGGHVYGDYAGTTLGQNAGGLGDSGSASRFFYSAKADAEDRLGSKHPTVKPVDLMAYLCRLVTPAGGTVLDPFAGTGTTGLGAMNGGFDAILIEREAEYVADIERRLAWARGEGRLTAQEQSRALQEDDHGPLFK